jgi:leader peptidase (prepilin peptidase)/N-methyltransferase
MGLLSLGLFLKFGLSPQYFLFFLFSAALVIISFIDLHHQIIPDIISLPGIIIGLAVSFVFIHIGWMDSMIGIIAGGGSLYIVAFVFERLTGKEGMGGGDVKLLAMIGAWMGWRGLLFIILLSSLTGTVIGSISLLAARKGLKAKIPFGPFLSLGALIYLFWGQELKFWYYNLFLL